MLVGPEKYNKLFVNIFHNFITRYPCDAFYLGCFFFSKLTFQHGFCQSEHWLKQSKLLPVVMSLRHLSDLGGNVIRTFEQCPQTLFHCLFY